jgi:hypothetical protein
LENNVVSSVKFVADYQGRFGRATKALHIRMKMFPEWKWPLYISGFLSLASIVSAQVGTEAVRPKYEELYRKVENRGDHTVTFVLVKPTKLPLAPSPAAPREPTVEEKTAAERRANKAYESITISATVYVGSRTVTVLSWKDDLGVTYRALSNVDFRLLTQLADIETNDTVYSWISFIGAMDGEPPDSVSAADLRKLSLKQSDYLFLGSPKEQHAAAKGLGLLDHLHAYFQINEEKLKRDFVLREAAEKEAEDRRRNTTPVSPVITFWVENGAKR